MTGFGEFVERHTAIIEPLEREGAVAYWNASISGNGKDFERYSAIALEKEKIYCNGEEFRYVKSVKESNVTREGHLERIADILYRRYLGNQIDPGLLKKIIVLSTEVENRFSVFRPRLGGRELTNNDVNGILRESTDSSRRREVWEASKSVGRIVSDDLLRLVEMRNEAAGAVGFGNYHSMALALAEQDEAELDAIFAELEDLTREPFLEAKEEIDEEFSGIYGISPDDIRPWHYRDPFFQEGSVTGGVDLDKYYSGKDILAIAREFYAGIGLPVDDILERSDLYERKGKNPHAFCCDIDRKGDIRILCNLRNDFHWMETILHELGHAVYDKYIDRSLPFLVRIYPHIAVTEAVAMYFGRLSKDLCWMKRALDLGGRGTEEMEGELKRSSRNRQLVFARWVQTMYNFEKELYRDPGQDLNALWWDMVERYQFVKRPDDRDEPDWAAKIHIVSVPAYYHNYMLGELIASQLQDRVKSGVAGAAGDEGCIHGNCAVGEFFRESVFGPGNTVSMGELLETVTGAKLQPRFFVDQYIEEKS